MKKRPTYWETVRKVKTCSMCGKRLSIFAGNKKTCSNKCLLESRRKWNKEYLEKRNGNISSIR